MLYRMLNVQFFSKKYSLLYMALFFSSVMSCFPGMSIRHFLNDFETVPLYPIIIGITFVLIFHTTHTSIVRPLYFKFVSNYYYHIHYNHHCRYHHYHHTFVRNVLNLDCIIYTVNLSDVSQKTRTVATLAVAYVTMSFHTKSKVILITYQCTICQLVS